MHGSMRRVRKKFTETEMNRHFGKTLATQDSHIHQTTISFTYTSNLHKLHIYIKPPQASHIHQTQASHIKPQANKGKYMGHKWNKRVSEEVHLLQYETK